MAAPPKLPVIDAIEFARKGLAIHDTIALSQFVRLSDVVSSTDGELDYELSGYVDAEGKPRLRLHIYGKALLVCQRCLEPLEFAIAVDTDFILVADENILRAHDDSDELEDYLVSSPQMRVIELLEDELLLALPYAPKHEGECADKASIKMDSKKQSPFAVLKGLKTRDRD
jgi:uncharacterized protein